MYGHSMAVNQPMIMFLYTVSWGIIGPFLLISQESFTMETLILLHLEDLSFFYPIIASKASVVAFLSYSNCFTTPTLIDNYWTPVGINEQSYCRLPFQLCTVNHTVVTKNKHIIIAKCLLQ